MTEENMMNQETTTAALEQSTVPTDGTAGQKHFRSRIIGNVIYFGVLLFLLASLVLYTQKENADLSVFGFHIYNVLTDSMKSEIPPGSLVVVKETDAAAISVGNDITFYVRPGKSITHRVMQVVPPHAGMETGFVTQGVDNDSPDEEIAYAQNVVGVVQFHVPRLGFAMRFVSENIVLVGTFFTGFLLFIWVLGRFIRACREERRLLAEKPCSQEEVHGSITVTAGPAEPDQLINNER